MKKGLVLVTGAGGFNGRYLLELLLENGYRVRATDLQSGERTAPTAYYEDLGIDFIPSDLTDPSTLPPVLEGVDYVMHVASLFDYSAPLELNRKVNVEGAKNLCEAAKRAKIKKMVLWSTLGVYGAQTEMPVTEESVPNPGNPYEVSKMEQEKAVLDYSNKGKFPVVVMRPAPVYGPGNRYGFINIIKLSTATPHVPVPVFMNSRLPSVHVRDVAGAGLFLLEQSDDKTAGEIFNVIDDTNIDLRDFLFLVAGLLGKETIKIHIPIHLPAMLRIGHFGAAVSKYIAENYLKKRPLIEDATIDYMAYNHIYSNIKLKKFGYAFQYPDCRTGLIEMVDWIKSEDMEPLRLFPKKK